MHNVAPCDENASVFDGEHISTSDQDGAYEVMGDLHKVFYG